MRNMKKVCVKTCKHYKPLGKSGEVCRCLEEAKESVFLFSKPGIPCAHGKPIAAHS